MLPYGKQFVDQDDINEVVRVLQSDFLTTGPEIAELERAMCDAVGARHAVACANGTAALHLAALAIGLGQGDQVIVPSISFVATANASRYCGADVVFADVDPETAMMTPQNLEDALQRADPARVKAIFVVHMGGHAAEMPALKAIADRVGAALVEDACHALGTTYQDAQGNSHPIGGCAHSDFATLSLHPVKTITCGEGGIVFTPNDEYARRMSILRTHGLTREPDDWTNASLAFDNGGQAPNPWYYEMQDLGYNYRLTDFQAAMARSQLAKLGMFSDRRRRLVSLYRDRIGSDSNVLALVNQPEGTDPVLHLMVALIDFAAIGRSRSQVMADLRQLGVGTQVHYIPIHRQPFYAAGGDVPDLPGADSYYSQCLSLPLYPAMEDGDVDVVCTALRQVIG